MVLSAGHRAPPFEATKEATPGSRGRSVGGTGAISAGAVIFRSAHSNIHTALRVVLGTRSRP